MKKRPNRRVLSKVAALSTATFILGAAGSAFALYNQAHESIVLKKADGTPVMATDTVGNAYSVKNTCFNSTANCHGNKTAGGKLQYGYDDIERHSYHAQLGANEMRGWNPANPDSGDAWRQGAGPQGKNWVQSPGHVGSW